MQNLAVKNEPRNLISPEYQAMCRKMHEDDPTWGVFGQNFADLAGVIYKKHGCRSALDYGCGKRTMEKALGFPINNYDPAIPECSALPNPAEMVICTEVLEHIEPECLDGVLDHIRECTQKLALLTVATKPAGQMLPDGRNAHLIVRNYRWWLPKIWERFEIMSMTRDHKRMVLIGEPV